MKAFSILVPTLASCNYCRSTADLDARLVSDREGRKLYINPLEPLLWHVMMESVSETTILVLQNIDCECLNLNIRFQAS